MVWLKNKPESKLQQMQLAKRTWCKDARASKHSCSSESSFNEDEKKSSKSCFTCPSENLNKIL